MLTAIRKLLIKLIGYNTKLTRFVVQGLWVLLAMLTTIRKLLIKLIGLGVKVMSYFLIQQVSRCVRPTFHQGQLELCGQRQMLSVLSEHFHEQIPRKH